MHRKIIESRSFPSLRGARSGRRRGTAFLCATGPWCPGEASILSEWRAGASAREAMAPRASALAGAVRRSGRERPWRAPAEAERRRSARCLLPRSSRSHRPSRPARLPKGVTSLFAGGVDRICPIALAPGRRCISDTSDLFFLGVISVPFERTYI